MQSALIAVRTRRGLLAAALVVVGAILLLVLPGGGSRRGDRIAPSRTFDLRGAYLMRATSFTADPLLRAGTTPLVAVTPGGRGRPPQAHVLVRGRVVVARRLALPARGEAWQLVRWSGGQVGVALLRRAGDGLDVSLASFDSGRRLAAAHARLPVGVSSVARVAPWYGEPNDLYVLTWPHAPHAADRATGARPQVELAVLGGEPAFGRHVLTVALPLSDGRASDWDVLVARVSGALPDLVLVRRAGAGAPEVHVLSGESRFQQFILHAKLDLAPAIARRAQFVPALQDGKPVLWAIDPGARRATVRVFPLGASAAA